VIAWYGLNWIRMDYADGLDSLLGIPAWMLEVIVPVAFGLIGLRYFIKSVGWARLYVLHLKLARRQAQ
jgi:TRAP-type C4-dicarboxylate transport system permease small subunit